MTLVETMSHWVLRTPLIREVEANPPGPHLNVDLKQGTSDSLPEKQGRQGEKANRVWNFTTENVWWSNAFLLWQGKTNRRTLGCSLHLNFKVFSWSCFSPVFPAPSSQWPNPSLTVHSTTETWQPYRPNSLQPNPFSTFSAFRACSYLNISPFPLLLWMMTFFLTAFFLLPHKVTISSETHTN